MVCAGLFRLMALAPLYLAFAPPFLAHTASSYRGVIQFEHTSQAELHEAAPISHPDDTVTNLMSETVSVGERAASDIMQSGRSKEFAETTTNLAMKQMEKNLETQVLAKEKALADGKAQVQRKQSALQQQAAKEQRIESIARESLQKWKGTAQQWEQLKEEEQKKADEIQSRLQKVDEREVLLQQGVAAEQGEVKKARQIEQKLLAMLRSGKKAV